MAEKRTTFTVNSEDVDVLRKLIAHILDTESKIGQEKKRARLYNLDRRLYRARLRLEE